ncbi:MAG: hypothetical protein CBC42_04070 [Betaproteobacteria bacterium TMED82]|nr:MAG: hypothetical protein CBC42_04070 [Betaproteobacteria bacterium TMED82]|tara:strand:- start:29907 stop:30764 length:858 start_codon:yes stop_codon:yes gene_type:complete
MGALRILVVSQKGGVGKSTLSANLTAWFSDSVRKKTSLIDLDPHGSSSSWVNSAREIDAEVEHYVASEFGERRWLLGCRTLIRSFSRKVEVLISDLTWSPAMDPEFLHEFDLVIVPTSVSAIELAGTCKFLESISWVFQAKPGDYPSLLICPSRVTQEELSTSPFDKEFLSIPFLLLPPVLHDNQMKTFFKKGFVFDRPSASCNAFVQCAEAISQAGVLHKKRTEKNRTKILDRRILDCHNSKLSRFMSRKKSISNAASTDQFNPSGQNKLSRISKILGVTRAHK